MGLNPPFGVKAALANKFIDKALEFNPKLLILIVPPETERYYVPSLSLSLSQTLTVVSFDQVGQKELFGKKLSWTL